MIKKTDKHTDKGAATEQDEEFLDLSQAFCVLRQMPEESHAIKPSDTTAWTRLRNGVAARFKGG